MEKSYLSIKHFVIALIVNLNKKHVCISVKFIKFPTNSNSYIVVHIFQMTKTFLSNVKQKKTIVQLKIVFIFLFFRISH